MKVKQGGQGRLVVGRVQRLLVATEARHSVLVFGPTQSGKTSGLAIPAILEWDGPVIATSVKGDLASTCRAWRTSQGRTWIFDPTGTAGTGPSSRWTPLAEATSWGGAQRMAAWLVESAASRSGNGDTAFWYATARKLLAPLLLAAALDCATIVDVVRWNNEQSFDEPMRILERHDQRDAMSALDASANRDDRIASSVATTLETVLAVYEDPLVARSAFGCDIDPAELLSGNNTLFICGPAHEQARLQGVFAALICSVVAEAVEQAQRCGGSLERPLLIVLDEVANIAPIQDLDSLASTAAGLGIQLMTVCQDLAQLATRYGQERARTIANNHRAKLLLSGVADIGTLDMMSSLAGEQAVQDETVTSDRREGRTTRTTTTAYRRLVSTDQLRRVEPGEGVLIYGHLPPARLELRPWFEDNQLCERAKGSQGSR